MLKFLWGITKFMLILALVCIAISVIAEYWVWILAFLGLAAALYIFKKKSDPSSPRSDGSHKSSSADEYVVIDIETTGFSRKNDRIIEVAANKYRNGELLGTYHTYVNPGFPVYPHITQLTGITSEMLEDAPKIKSVKDDFLSFVGSSMLVGHNIVAFDIPFLREQLDADISNKTADTLKLAKEVFPGLPSYKLSFLDKALHLGGGDHHRAESDVAITHALYLACKKPALYQKFVHDKDALSAIEIEPRRKGYRQIDIHSITPTDPNHIPDTALAGKTVVFSGVFALPIDEMMQIAVDAGATLKSSVSKKVQYLVLGAQDWRYMDENGMTSKQRTAIKLISEGHDIKIITENEFLKLANQ